MKQLLFPFAFFTPTRQKNSKTMLFKFLGSTSNARFYRQCVMAGVVEGGGVVRCEWKIGCFVYGLVTEIPHG
jgi:hypothetical protein